MSRIVTVDWEYVGRLRRNFEIVRQEMGRNSYPPVQQKIMDYLRKGEEMLQRVEGLVGTQVDFPDTIYHFTNRRNFPGIDANGLFKSGNFRVRPMWDGRERGIVPGVYISKFDTTQKGVDRYDTVISITTRNMDPRRIMWDEDALSNSPLEALGVVGTAVYLDEIPRKWILAIDYKSDTSAA